VAVVFADAREPREVHYGHSSSTCPSPWEEAERLGRHGSTVADRDASRPEVSDDFARAFAFTSCCRQVNYPQPRARGKTGPDSPPELAGPVRDLVATMPAAMPAPSSKPLAGKGSSHVMLNVYDVGPLAAATLNSLLRPFGTGAFHCGVEVYDKEWSYCFVRPPKPGEAPRYCDITGIFCCAPRRCDGHVYLESVRLGVANINREQLLRLIIDMERDWMVSAYSTLHNNCGHFCSALCKRLGVDTPPQWVTSLAKLGAELAAVPQDTEMGKACPRDGQCGACRPQVWNNGCRWCGNNFGNTRATL